MHPTVWALRRRCARWHDGTSAPGVLIPQDRRTAHEEDPVTAPFGGTGARRPGCPTCPLLRPAGPWLVRHLRRGPARCRPPGRQRLPGPRRDDRRRRPHAGRARHRPPDLGGRVLASGGASGAWFGLFFGLLLVVFGTTTLPPFVAVLIGLLGGMVFGVVLAAVATAPPAGGATSPPPARWSPAATTCCASRATRRRPARCWPSSPCPAKVRAPPTVPEAFGASPGGDPFVPVRLWSRSGLGLPCSNCGYRPVSICSVRRRDLVTGVTG